MEGRFIKPIEIQGDFTQVYFDGRIRKSAQYRLIIQEIPEDPTVDDPVKLRIAATIAPQIILFGQRVTLSWAEYQFLKTVAEYVGSVASGIQVYRAVYGEYSEVSDDTLAVIRFRLVKKLQVIFGQPRIPNNWIAAVYGAGFQLHLRRSEVEIN